MAKKRIIQSVEQSEKMLKEYIELRDNPKEEEDE